MPQELFTSVRFSKHIRQAHGHNLGKALGDLCWNCGCSCLGPKQMYNEGIFLNWEKKKILPVQLSPEVVPLTDVSNSSLVFGGLDVVQYLLKMKRERVLERKTDFETLNKLHWFIFNNKYLSFYLRQYGRHFHILGGTGHDHIVNDGP